MVKVILIIIAIISTAAHRSIVNDWLAILAMLISWLSLVAYGSYGHVVQIRNIISKLAYLRDTIPGDDASNAVADALDIIKDETKVDYPTLNRRKEETHVN